MADVSAPTISRFESGDKNIQLSSALAILEVLGMVERSPIEFPEKVQRYDPDRDVVLFSGKTASGEIACAVSVETLEDCFEAKGSGERAVLKTFRTHRDAIENIAARKYIEQRMEPNGSILIRSIDVE